MNHVMTAEITEVMDAQHCLPAVLLVVPFGSKISVKKELKYLLETALDKVELQLLENFSAKAGRLFLHKINAVLDNLYFKILRSYCAFTFLLIIKNIMK